MGVGSEGVELPRLKYFKRYRMELDLRYPRPGFDLPPDFRWVPWRAELLDCHALIKHYAFRDETDAEVFPCLSTLAGCRDLMAAIVARPGFCPGATWLVEGPDGPVGTVQGLLEARRYGAVQNLGVVPAARGRGIGRALLLRALDGFAAAGATRAFLEVTACNGRAIGMYRRLGFRFCKTLQRAVELPGPEVCPEVCPAEVGIG